MVRWGEADEQKLNEIARAIHKAVDSQRIHKARGNLLLREIDSIGKLVNAGKIIQAKQAMRELIRTVERDKIM